MLSLRYGDGMFSPRRFGAEFRQIEVEASAVPLFYHSFGGLPLDKHGDDYPAMRRIAVQSAAEP